ncbi:MAG TPA: hypothetical protein VK600_00445 [Candidatus Saccharimonadales bacterium]|nr:hypothetical protein [Candidatus Saccharimonadales bacterium]
MDARKTVTVLEHLTPDNLRAKPLLEMRLYGVTSLDELLQGPPPGPDPE